MESILQGWLTKSPPEKKQLKLFGSKWRKRYFVLYAPPTVDGIPDAYTAILEYYSDKKLHHKRGTINLADCEEVLSSLDSDVHKHVFGLRTMHKSQVRTYYLAAETDPEMSKWVNKLCQVLGLTENDDVITGSHSQLPHRTQQNIRMTQTVKTSGSTRQPFARPMTHQSPAPPPPLRAVPSMPNAPFTRFNVSEPNLLDVTSPKSFTETRWETADVGRHLVSWNPPATSRMASPPGSLRMRNAESFPELDCLSPMARKWGNAPIEGRELPPIPPEKTGPKPIAEAQAQDIDYDLPKQKYGGRSKSDDQMNAKSSSGSILPQAKNSIAAKGENGVGLYNRPLASQSSDEWLNNPKKLTADGIDCSDNALKPQLNKRKYASQSGELCDNPKSRDSEWQKFSWQPQTKSDRRSGSGGQRYARSDVTERSNQTEDYDVPKSKLSDHDYGDDYNIPKSTTAHSFSPEDYDVPRSKDLSGFGSGLGVYNVANHQDLSQEDRLECLWERAFGGNQLQNDQVQRSTAQDVHPAYQSEAFNRISSSLPSAPNNAPEKPPRPFSRPSPDRQTAVADGNVRPGLDQSVSALQSGFQYSCFSAQENQADNNGIGPENVESYELKKAPSNAFIQRKSTLQATSSVRRHQVASNLPNHDSIRVTQRTKSFKRSIPSQDRSVLPLPVKRIFDRSESSSSVSSDEEVEHASAMMTPPNASCTRR